ncbi:HAD family hydrolase [Caproiciproducens sp. NJN-50]|uniref:HAD-IA family hydrolase n=1 Tax=Acutalibacteraceae TaxID=3082771 RepID=UPI000FFE1445|nr:MULTISPECIES: HAD-IA family hydrolase [Acutalibacteraceae]QAT48313.1 HAD family hydrolase [Caproiciproducens sp. NJN-50]
MSLRCDLILFDLDGTLTDSGPGITNGLREAFRHVGWPVPGPQVLRRFIGPPLLNMLKELFPRMTEKTTAELIGDYRRYYAERGAFENEVYPGIFDLLDELRLGGAKLAVVTSKPATPTKRILDYFGLSPHFDYVSAESDSDRGSGKEFLIRPALEHFGVPASRAVMIGDTKYDAAGARRAGTNFVGVLYGFGTREEMEREGGEHFSRTVEDLRGFLIDK